MKRDNKKVLYESIMTSVAKEVKKVLNDDSINEGFLDNIKAGLNTYKDEKDKDKVKKEKGELTQKMSNLIDNNALLLAQAFKAQAEIAQIMDKLGAPGAAEAWRKRRVELAKFLEKDKSYWQSIKWQLDKINQQ